LLRDNLLTAFQTNPSFFSISVIRKISAQILQALTILHSLNIIHADLKPENIMIKSYNPV
jgi:serine/threonine protein kinase